ncbi:MAG: hypothetical protein PsegKO_00430 [Pseudohongiellaceae bacterium]|jgi:hypothetical protein
MNKSAVKFATQVDAEILTDVRSLAREEGRQIQALVNEALADLLRKRRSLAARPHVMEAYLDSHESYAAVYRKLAE